MDATALLSALTPEGCLCVISDEWGVDPVAIDEVRSWALFLATERGEDGDRMRQVLAEDRGGQAARVEDLRVRIDADTGLAAMAGYCWAAVVATVLVNFDDQVPWSRSTPERYGEALDEAMVISALAVARRKVGGDADLHERLRVVVDQARADAAAVLTGWRRPGEVSGSDGEVTGFRDGFIDDAVWLGVSRMVFGDGERCGVQIPARRAHVYAQAGLGVSETRTLHAAGGQITGSLAALRALRI